MKWIFFDLGATLVDESDVYKSWCGRLSHAEFSSVSALYALSCRTCRRRRFSAYA